MRAKMAQGYLVLCNKVFIRFLFHASMLSKVSSFDDDFLIKYITACSNDFTFQGQSG